MVEVRDYNDLDYIDIFVVVERNKRKVRYLRDIIERSYGYEEEEGNKNKFFILRSGIIF